MTTEERLQEAIDAAEIVRIIYNGGSQPGTLRDIAPTSINNGKVLAQCYSSNAVKSFIVEKIKVVDGKENPKTTEWSPDAKPTRQYESLSEVLEKERNCLSGLGWHIENDRSRLSLHRRFKNGNPMKGSDVSLDYEEFTYDSVLGPDGELHEENRRKRQRPWSVRGKNKHTNSYGSLDKAAVLFIEWAKSLSPSK